MSRALVAVLAAALSKAALAQPAPNGADIARLLTGGSSRAWIAQRIVRPPEPGRSCAAGEIYTFSITAQVTIDRCEAGSLVASQHAWSLSESPPLAPPTLAISGVGSYAIIAAASGHQITMHALSGDKQLTRDAD